MKKPTQEQINKNVASKLVELESGLHNLKIEQKKCNEENSSQKALMQSNERNSQDRELHNKTIALSKIHNIARTTGNISEAVFNKILVENGVKIFI